MRGVRQSRKRITAVAINRTKHVLASTAFHFQIAAVSRSTNTGMAARSENCMYVARLGFQQCRQVDQKESQVPLDSENFYKETDVSG